MTRWVAMMCGDETQTLLQRHPNAFLLCSQIAIRARWKDCPITKLKAGQAFIGDWKNAGLPTEMAYRHAKRVLEECGLVTFQGTNKGTIATVVGSTIFSISSPSNNDQGNSQETDTERSGNRQGTTNKTDTWINGEKKNSMPLPPLKVELPHGEQFAKAWESWRKHLSEIRKPLKPTMEGTQLRILAGYPEEMACKFVDQAIAMGWQALRDFSGGPLKEAPQLNLGGRHACEVIKIQARK